MDKLIHELQRLYFLDGQQGCWSDFDDSGRPAGTAAGALTPERIAPSLVGSGTVAVDPVDAKGRSRTLVVDFARAADWEHVARLYQGIQEDLELPAPAVSVSGRAGYRLWLSVGDGVPVADAGRFLEALRLKYLAEIPRGRLGFSTDAGETGPRPVDLAPALDEATGKWSAFIDPSMGAMFVDESGLDMAPNMDRQAEMLAGLKSIDAADFQRALDTLSAPAEASARRPADAAVEPDAGAGQSAPGQGGADSRLAVATHYSDPKAFLLAVMNDPSARTGDRIEAAKALLPYFAAGKGE